MPGGWPVFLLRGGFALKKYSQLIDWEYFQTVCVLVFARARKTLDAETFAFAQLCCRFAFAPILWTLIMRAPASF